MQFYFPLFAKCLSAVWDLQTMADKAIGANVRQLRMRRIITLDALTMRTGLSTGCLSRIERGPSSPPIATLRRIAFTLSIEHLSYSKIANASRTKIR